MSIAPPAELADDLRTQILQTRFVGFDFDGVFTDNMVYIDQDGRESVRCSRADGIGLAKLRGLGIEMAIISSEPNPVVLRRAEKLKLACHHGVADKLALLHSVIAALGIGLAEVAFVGNDLNDAAVLRAVGLPIVVQDALPDVRELGKYRTRTPGGYGAVREVCELIAAVRQAAKPYG